MHTNITVGEFIPGMHLGMLLESKFAYVAERFPIIAKINIRTEAELDLETCLNTTYIQYKTEMWTFGKVQKQMFSGKVLKVFAEVGFDDFQVGNSYVFVEVEKDFDSYKYAIYIASKNKTYVDAISKAFHDCPILGPAPVQNKRMVEVMFWYNSSHGPTYSLRKIESFTWDEIKDNYPKEPRDFLDNIFSKDWCPTTGNQLLLWTGPPGTGKTSALRALVKEWKSWAETYFIMDPETFLSSPEYLTSVLLRNNSERDEYGDPGYDPDTEIQHSGKEKWKIIILEDAGSLIAKTSNTENTAGLSKLLNLCDGFIGQGLKIMLIITSNEEIEDLNPAITRPGRAFGNILFPAFEKEEAKAWLYNHGVEIELGTKNVTLAQLYSYKDGNKYVEKTKSTKLGFIQD